MANTEIAEVEKQIVELTAKLNELRKSTAGDEVRNYSFATINGETSLLDLFGDRKQLLLIHNYGSGMPILHTVGGWLQRFRQAS